MPNTTDILPDGVEALTGRATSHGPIRGPITAQAVAGGRGIVIQVPLAGDGTDARSVAALMTLRDRVLPATIGRAPGVRYAVTGNTAWSHDLDAALHSRTPLVFLVVAALAVMLYGGDLPDVARKAGSTVKRLRGVADDLKRQVQMPPEVAEISEVVRHGRTVADGTDETP